MYDDDRQTEIAHFKELHSLLLRKRRWYEIQLAKYEGPNEPFHLAYDLDRTKEDIEKTELQLVQLGDVSHLPTSVLNRLNALELEVLVVSSGFRGDQVY